jgi:hypothetical protein
MREYTNKIADMVADGLLNKEQLIFNLLMWMSEDDVMDFYMANIAPDFDTDEDDDG